MVVAGDGFLAIGGMEWVAESPSGMMEQLFYIISSYYVTHGGVLGQVA